MNNIVDDATQGGPFFCQVRLDRPRRDLASFLCSPFLGLFFFIKYYFYSFFSPAHQHDNWLLILVISRVRLAPIVSIRLP